MTNKEAVIAEIQVEGYSDNAITKALLDFGIPADGNYTVDNGRLIAQAAVKVLNTMLGTKSITEGGYSITYSIAERLAALNDEYGLIVKAIPTVRARSLW